MTTPVFPELALIAKIETVEAVARNIEEAVLFEIGSVVGNEAAAIGPLTSDDQCVFVIGDGAMSAIIEGLLRTICLSFSTLVDRFIGIADALRDSIRDFLDSFLRGVVETFTNLVDTLTERLSAVVSAIVETVSDLLDTIVERLGLLVDAMIDAVSAVIDNLEEILGAIFQRIAEVVTAILDKIEEVFRGLLAVARSVIDRIADGISAVIDALVNTVDAVFATVGQALTGLIETLTGVAEGGLSKIREVIESIPSTLREVFEDATTFVGEAVGDRLSNMGDIIVSQVEAFFARLIDEQELSPDKVINEFLTGVGIPAEEAARIAQAADRAMPRTPFPFVIALAAMVPFIIGPVVTAILSPAITQLSQEIAQRVTPTLIPPANAVDALLRGEMTEAQFREDLSQAGYNTERQDILVRTSRRLLDLGELFRWWLRGIIDDGELDTQLGFLRIDPVDRDRLKEAAFFIPPVGDLIRMAVREVFSPEIRERFGQDEGFPEEFAEFAEQQGVSSFWAKAFWAAHWALPSPQQGFEMLHRKVIEPADLDLLLRAQDVMPFWREKLVAIAFRPLTRVDLRRMHKLGIFDAEELQRRYEDLGFAPDNAALMVQFTLEFNSEDPPEDPGELEGLTRATVLGMYEDGVITRAQALDVMLELGFTEDASQLFLIQRDLEIERATRRNEIQLVLDLVRSGAIDFAAGQDRLAQLGLQPAELAKATTAVLREQERQTSIPPRGDLDKMLTAQLIDDGQYVEALSRRGFTRFWADKYLSLASGA